MKKTIKKIGCFLVALIMTMDMFSQSISAETTSDKIKNAQEQKKQTENKLDETKDTLDTLKDSKVALEGSLNKLNSELTKVSDKLADIETQMDDKQTEIDKTSKELEDATKQADDQYAFIKARIKVLYEKGNDTYADLFLNSSDFGQFMNKAVYIEKVNEYDQQMLQKMKDLRDETAEKKKKLESEKKDLEKLKTDAESEQDKVKDLVSDTSNSITSYAGAISDKEKEALAYEATIESQKNTISSLKTQLAQEEALARKSQSMAKRSLSEVTFAGDDRELLAAIIQCEAGGEPWEGKIAVGSVIMNRVCSGAFPNTIVGVVYQANQFSPVASGRLAMRLAEGADDECLKAADAVMSGTNNIGNCLFFRTVVPGIQGTIIGHHVFYLYWTGRESGYGTVEDSTKQSTEEASSSEAASSEASSDASSDASTETSTESDSSSDSSTEQNNDA